MGTPCCLEFVPGLAQIDACIVFCANHSAGPKYNTDPIRFCPWCGAEINPLPKQDPEFLAECQKVIDEILNRE